ncbi:MAG: TIGR03915 family putative DNA repair protein [Lachnospiraceae bacterium]|nr:TIGR03915 family putative DNA repair protein [Lachnospiraceae bacterium]
MEEKYIICEDSLEGIFTAVYDAYALREGHEHLHVQVGEDDNYRLFAEYLYSQPDLDKTDKVVRTLKRRVGDEVYGTICRAAASYDKAKGDAVYHTIVDGITGRNGSGGNGRRTMENLRNPYVLKTFELARRTANEVHHEVEFIRFKELQQDILYAKIGPENNVVPFLMPHFADRLSVESFMIHDEKRDLFGVHPAKKEWYLVSGVEGFEEESLVWSDNELKVQELFTLFHKTIAIAERKNSRLQQQMLPLRFQEYMVEFGQK